jgi:hypothetical protein
VGSERVDDAHQRCALPGRAELRRPVRRRVRRESDERDQHGDDDDETDPGEDAPRQIAPRLPSLLREVRHRLETRVGEERKRQRERDLVPRGLRTDVEPTRERARREEKGEAEHDEQQLSDEIEDRYDERERVEATRPAHQADESDRDDHYAAHDHVAGALRDRMPADREPQVVREEEGRERDHDQVVEKERPAGDEPGEVVEGDADEGRRAAGLPDHRRPLRVRQGHDEKEDADHGENRRRQPERVQGDDAEREVDRGRHLAVRDGG